MVKKTLRWEVPALPSLRSLHPEFVAFRITFSLQSTSLYGLSYNTAFSKNPEKAPPTVRYMNGSFKKTSASTDFSVFGWLKQRWQWNPGWDSFPDDSMTVSEEAPLTAGAHVPGTGLTASPEDGRRFLTLESTALASTSLPPSPSFLPPRLSVASCLPREKVVYVIKQWLVKFNLSLLTSQ